jgi:hypothetical protein
MLPADPGGERLETGDPRADIVRDLEEPVEMVGHQAGGESLRVRGHQCEDLGRKPTRREDRRAFTAHDNDMDDISLIEGGGKAAGSLAGPGFVSGWLVHARWDGKAADDLAKKIGHHVESTREGVRSARRRWDWDGV